MIRVGINGYGTVGKRIADAVRSQPDMELVGVAKTTPNFEARGAVDRGMALYAAPGHRLERFERSPIDVEGPVEELVEASDVVVDATPSGVGEENRELYESRDTPAIFQGGEPEEVADVSFNARANYGAAAGCEFVRVVSCNTTGLCRLLSPLDRAFPIEAVRATLVRRGGDPGQSDRGPINDILPDPVSVPSHHALDVQTVLPDLPIVTLGVKVPATLMHLHGVTVTFEERPGEGVRERLAADPRILFVDEGMAIDGCGQLKEYAKDLGRKRGDLWENCVWTESITVEDRSLHLFQAIHQESVVVPENVDAIRAMTGTRSAESSRRTTNETLGIGPATSRETVAPK